MKELCLILLLMVVVAGISGAEVQNKIVHQCESGGLVVISYKIFSCKPAEVEGGNES